MSSKITNQAFVTLATTDNYAIGALTLAQSLRAVNTNRMLAIMITNDVCESLKTTLSNTFDHIEIIDVLNSNDEANLSLLKRPELGVTFSKLHCWRLTRYNKCVFLDADCLVVKNVDDLFDRDEFSAAPDVGWPDCFNSGVFVFAPSTERYSNLLSFAVSKGSFDGGDQGLLNAYFSNWGLSDASKRLPFIYNMTTNVAYTYAPAFKHFSDQVKIVHFIGSNKPWYYTYNTASQRVTGNVTQHESAYVNYWWRVFAESVYPTLGDDLKDRLKTQYIQKVSGSSTTPGSDQTPQQSSNEMNFSNIFGAPAKTVVIGSEEHRQLWEQGQIDYTGRDSFANIQAHLDAQLNKKK